MSLPPNNNICEPAKPITTDWNSIKWNKINRHVTSLQRRIYHASRENDRKRVRDLQRQLTNSNSALIKAINRVTKVNKGKYTPGVDGFRAISDKSRSKLYDDLRNRKMKLHRPKPVLRKYIPKKNGKLRSLGIPTIKDRIFQEVIRMAMEPEWEAKFEPTSNGFRPHRRQHDSIRRNYYNIQSGKWCWVFEGDFQACFDTLSHEFILKQIRDFPHYNLVKRFLEAGYVDNGVFYETHKGTPQGGLLSPLLANIALHGMEDTLEISYKKYVRNRNGTISENFIPQGKYRISRFADDFLIFSQNKEDIKNIPTLLEPYLSDRGLILSKEKSKISHISEGFNFLGFNFKYDKDNVARIRPAKISIQKFKQEIDYICKTTYGDNVGTLIDRLNPVIRGTANYWRYAVSTSYELADMDHYIWNKTFKFLKRLHPNKGKRWIKNRYFPPYNDGKHHSNWVLSDPKSGEILEHMSWFKPRRYVMVKHDYSPYDRDKIDYFESRKANFSLSTR